MGSLEENPLAVKLFDNRLYMLQDISFFLSVSMRQGRKAETGMPNNKKQKAVYSNIIFTIRPYQKAEFTIFRQSSIFSLLTKHKSLVI